jgi:hypothetical protein
MIARSSNPGGRVPRSSVGSHALPLARRLFSEERGAILAMVALLGLIILGLTGTVIDFGLGYVDKARLSRAVDAGVLAGARSLRSGQDVARGQALALANANSANMVAGASFDVGFGSNAEGENTVWMTASRPRPTFFLRAIGMDELNVGSTATAAVPPLDLVLVIDQSGSLATAGAWDDLQLAAKDFVDFFDDDIDQMGLVSFNTKATERHLISHSFTGPIKADINAMSSAGWTNYGEGLRLALAQITSGTVRDRSVKVVVFFTDGRPTAFRGTIGGQDRVMAISQTSPLTTLGGYFNNPDALPSDAMPPTNGCANQANCATWTEQGPPQVTVADQLAHQKGRDRANDIRASGAFLYTIGLGDPNANAAYLPNTAFMQELANVDGVANPDQPQGKYYFAPDATQLQTVFNQLAQDLLVRLAQ